MPTANSCARFEETGSFVASELGGCPPYRSLDEHHGQVAMGNYPYAGDLFGKGLQAWPLRAACRELRHGKPLKSLAAAVGSYYNATGLGS